MTRLRWVGLVLILLSSGISILWGTSIARSVNGWVDFRSYYFGTRTLLDGHDPYNQSEFVSVYRAEGGEWPNETPMGHETVTVFINLPPTFVLVAPFALLPWGLAHVLWMLLTSALLIAGAFLVWDVGSRGAPVLSTFLICFLLANCEVVFITGNAAGIVVGLCVVAVWCFLNNRFAVFGVLCMVISLAIKPHDAGFVWLYFLLAGGTWRKRALQSLAITACIGVAALLWVSHVAPGWVGNWHANMAEVRSPNGLNNPGLDSLAGRTAGMVIDLQSAVIVFIREPRLFNPVSYFICGLLLLVWALKTFTSRPSAASAWFSMAAIVPLTMIVTYHRTYDAMLMMLTIPACAMLWAEGGMVAWVATLLTTAGLVLTGTIPLVVLFLLTGNLNLDSTGVFNKILTVLAFRPTPLILLAMSIFYLWVYVRHRPTRLSPNLPQTPGKTPLASTAA